MRGLPDSDIQTINFLQEVSTSIFRTITWVTAGVFLLWAYILGASTPAQYLTQVIWMTIPALFFLWLSFSFVEKNFFAALIFWQISAIIPILLGLYFFQKPEISLLLIFLPAMTVICLGWPFALGNELLIVGVLGWVYIRPDLFQLPSNDYFLILGGGVLVIILTEVIISQFLAISQYSYREYRSARNQVEETRRQRMELLQTQEDLLQANRELARLSGRLKVLTQVAEDARKVKEEFVANVSHELRTPLNMIIGFSELISKAPYVYGDLPATLLADIAAIQRNSQHLSELVNDVLDLSQIEAGKMGLVKDWTTLQELVNSAVSATKVLFDSKNLYIRTSIPTDEIHIYCDKTRVREVLLNILSNAGRFTEQGGVTIQADENEDELLISITDTGPGISQEDQLRLFEPFQQLDTSIRRVGGTGLGLSISKRFVEMHGGTMWLESQLGIGTTFHFTLPLQRVRSMADSQISSKRWFTPYHQVEVDYHPSKAPKPVVLPQYVLLDHGSGLDRLFNRNLDDVEVKSTNSLDDATQILSRSPSQGLIINRATVDIPWREIFKNMVIPYETPVMYCWITGEDEKALQLGVVDYLVKPVLRDQLLESINKIGKEIHTILLVDDDVEILQLFARIINSADRGYVVLRAKNGEQALEIMRERHPDVVLMDLVMPELDGFQVIRKKNKDDSIRDIPVIVISSKDPTGAPILSDHLTITRKNGFSSRELLTCIQAVSEILAPEAPSNGRVRKLSAPV